MRNRFVPKRMTLTFVQRSYQGHSIIASHLPLNISERVWSSQAQQVDCSRYEVLGRQSFDRLILSSFQERPVVSSLQNAGDDGQCTLTLFRGRIKITSTIASHSPLNISETVRDRGFVPKDHNRKWSMGNPSHVTMQLRHVTPKGQTRDHSTIRAQYLGNSRRCYSATIANYQRVCCEAVRSAILTTTRLLQFLFSE